MIVIASIITFCYEKPLLNRLRDWYRQKSDSKNNHKSDNQNEKAVLLPPEI